MSDLALTEPLVARVGDTWIWERQDLAADYPANGGWTLKYGFKSAANHFEITAGADGAFHKVNVAAATTAVYTADTYSWVAYVAGGSSEQYSVGSGIVKVLPAYTGTAVLDDRTHAQKVLTSIEAVIEGRASKDQEQYSIAGRELRHTPIPVLLQLRDKYRAEVFSLENAERRRMGFNAGRLVTRL
jgi:hypothetical protein